MAQLPNVSTLIDVLGTLQDLYSFLSNDLPQIISTLGDGNLRSAQGALNDLDLSSNPERELTIAITHLQNAYEKFYAVGNGKKSLFNHATTVALMGSVGGAEQRTRAFMNAHTCSLLIAMCYKYLREEELVKRYINQAQDSLDRSDIEYRQSKNIMGRVLFSGNTKRVIEGDQNRFSEIVIRLSRPISSPRRLFTDSKR